MEESSKPDTRQQFPAPETWIFMSCPVGAKNEGRNEPCALLSQVRALSPAKIHHCAPSSRASAPRAEGFGFLKPPKGGLLSQAVLPWGEASPGRQLPGMLPGWVWGWELCYLLALTTLQLPRASKGTLQLLPGHPLTAHSPGREHSRRLTEHSLVCSPLFIHNLHRTRFPH